MINLILIISTLVTLTFIFLPKVGLLARWQNYRLAQQRITVEDALKHIHTCEWRGQTASLDSVAGALHLTSARAAKLIDRMASENLVQLTSDGLHLTPTGEQLAIAVIRAHRLWERYLADEARMPLTHIHAEAERLEHDHAQESLLALEASLGHPRRDPHGDPIPAADGKLEQAESQPVTAVKLNTSVRIVHIEDEPDTLFAQIIAHGLRPGQHVRVIESSPQRITLSDGERTYDLAPIIAANIFVAPNGHEASPRTKRLTALKPGQTARVHALDEGLQGFTRRRLLDLGLTPGVGITLELPNMFNDPIAYRVRGTLVALRREQAEQILIEE